MRDSWTLEDWIDWLEKAYGEGMIELDDLDKVELLDLLKELERRRADDGEEIRFMQKV